MQNFLLTNYLLKNGGFLSDITLISCAKVSAALD